MSSYVKIKVVLTIFISILLSYTVYQFFSRYNTDAQIVVAMQPINEREVVEASMLKVIDVSKAAKDTLTQNAAASIEEIDGKFLAKVNIPEGRPIDMRADLVLIDKDRVQLDEFGEPIVDVGVSESYVLEENERLIALQLDKESTLNNRITKGDLVDVFGTYSTDDDATIGLLIGQNILVHDVEQIPEDDDLAAEQQTIILKVTPEEAMDMVYMKKSGEITAILSSARAKYIRSEEREVNISTVRANVRAR